MTKLLPSEMSSAKRIAFCKDGLIDCDKKKRRIFWIYMNLRRVYSSLAEIYEAELDAAKDSE